MEPFAPKNLPTEAEFKPQASATGRSGFLPFTKAIQGVTENDEAGNPSDSSGSGHGTSHVEYVEEEGVVTKIVVTCHCGEVTVIDCLYDAE